MERNREAKRGNMAAVNGIGLSRRRHRITVLRDSHEEEGEMGLRETVGSRERERLHKVDRVRDRDQELMSQSKRRRMERYTKRSKHRDVEGGAGTQDSSGPSGEDTCDEDYEEPSSSMSNHALRRSITPTRNVRSMSGLLVADEMLGILVPRRARSASVRRFNAQWNSSAGGFGERQSRRRLSLSSLSGSVDIVSPSSSSVSLRKKMKPLGPKSLISKGSRKPFPSVEDDIEIEVVEALFDLMKQSQSQLQSQSFNKDERTSDDISTEKLDLICNKDLETKSVRSPNVSAEIASEASDLPLDVNSTSAAPLDVGENSWFLDKKELSTESALKLGKMSSDAMEQMGGISVEKGKDSSETAQESDGGDQVVVSKREQSRSCAKSNGDDSAHSTVSKANSATGVVKTKRDAKFEIDLMAPPPMPSSPDRDGSNTMVPDLKFLGIKAQMKSDIVAKEEYVVAGKVQGGKKMDTIYIKQKLQKLDLEKPEQENVSSCSYNNLQQRGAKEPKHYTLSDSERQNFGQSNSLPSLVVATGWPGSSPLPGYMAPLKTLLPMDETARTIALQLAPFTLSQPRPKRCMTHQYIACNIRHHQQLTKNCVQPAATGPATSHEAKACSRNRTASIPNSILGNPLQGDLPGRHALATPPVLSMKGKSLEVENTMDTTKTKQLAPQQTLEQAPAGNLLDGPALIFPPGQHVLANVPAQQPGSTKSATVFGKAAFSNNSAGGLAVGSLSFPAGAAAVTFNCSNFPANEAPPFMAMLQNNVHPYSISTNSGMPLPFKGAQAPVLPFLNASYHPSIFHVPQNQQKQSTWQLQSNPIYQVQQASLTTGTSSSASSSHKQSKSRQQIVSQTSSHGCFSSEGLQQQQSQKQHVLGSDSSDKSVDSRGSHAQKASNGQNYGIPFQAMNFASMSHGDGKQQQLVSEHRVAVIPPQAIGFSFDSSASTTPAVNFSALPPDSAVIQILSDVGQLGYPLVSSAQVAQHKNFLVAEKKSVVNSTDTDDGKKAILAKSVSQSLSFPKLNSSNPSVSTVKEVAADGSAQTWSFLPPPNTRNQVFASSSTAPTAVFSINAPKSQQEQEKQELIQLQKQHTKQMQLTGTAQVHATISNRFPYSFIGCNYPNNPVFSLVHNNNFVQSSPWKNASVPTTSQVPSLATTSSLKNLPQQQSRNSQGQPHIYFGSSLKSATSLQGQQFLIKRHLTSSIVDGHSSNSCASTHMSGSGSMKTTLGGSKAWPAFAELPPQQVEPSNASSQKSTPVCGRDVPSILITSPSQQSELRY